METFSHAPTTKNCLRHFRPTRTNLVLSNNFTSVSGGHIDKWLSSWVLWESEQKRDTWKDYRPPCSHSNHIHPLLFVLWVDILPHNWGFWIVLRSLFYILQVELCLQILFWTQYWLPKVQFWKYMDYFHKVAIYEWLYRYVCIYLIL